MVTGVYIDHLKELLSVAGFNPIGSMALVYLPTWIVDFDGKLVGKYISPMDPMEIIFLDASDL